MVCYSPYKLQKKFQDDRIYIQLVSSQTIPQALSPLCISTDCIVKFAIYYPYYKEKLRIIESTYNLFHLWQFSKLILVLRVLYDHMVKIKKLLCYEPKMGKHIFTICYLY